MSLPSSPEAGTAPGPRDVCEEIVSRLQALEHGMRTPLGTLTAALELLKLSGDAASRDHALQVMERQIRQLTTQLEQLHDISRDLRRATGGQPSPQWRQGTPSAGR